MMPDSVSQAHWSKFWMWERRLVTYRPADRDGEASRLLVLNKIYGFGQEVFIVVAIEGVLIWRGAAAEYYCSGHVDWQQPMCPEKSEVLFHKLFQV